MVLQTVFKFKIFEILLSNIETLAAGWAQDVKGSVITSAGLFTSMIGKNFILILTNIFYDE
jgi:hypothetical protein